MPRILLIDDEAMVRATLRDFLEVEGYEVVEAPNGRRGLELFEAAPTDVVITDVLMPEKEGVETIMELRRRFPDTKIVAISGGGNMGNLEYLRLAGKLGADRILAKPVAIGTLHDTLSDLLESGPPTGFPAKT